ncbi:MAG: DUF2306 domain-containing protein [Paracoccaceae bacterium]|nr:DUF2306 domain-containing protein [Paracoccaceae bacterium]
MNFTALTNASLAIHIHLAAVALAITLTIAIFYLRKGTSLHKLCGRIWVAGMAMTALSSFWISTGGFLFGFSFIHLISVYVLVQLFRAIRAAKLGRIFEHKYAMLSIVWGGLVVAGFLSFLPGRIMFRLFFT